MANPQRENGYTGIANEILSELAREQLNGTQFRIVLVVFRFTYGFQRKEHELSESFISKATSIHKQQIKRELKELILRKILTVAREAGPDSSRVIGFNKNYDEWEGKLKRYQVAKKIPGSELDTTPGSEKDTTPGSGLATQERNNLKKILKEKDIYSQTEKNKTTKTVEGESSTTENQTHVEKPDSAKSEASQPGFLLPTSDNMSAKTTIEPVVEKIILTPDEAEFIAVLETVKDYPLDRQKDLEYYHLLIERYPEVDALEAIKDWAIYKIGSPLKPKSNARSQINTSFQKCVEWRKHLKTSTPKGANNGRLLSGNTNQTPKPSKYAGIARTS